MSRPTSVLLLLAGFAAAGEKVGEIIPIPFVFSYPETSWGGGAKLRWQDPMGKPGFADFTVLASLRGQSDIDGTYERDSLAGVWRVKVFAERGKFPMKWFGPGNPPADSLEGLYTPLYGGGFVQVNRLLPAGWAMGARLRLEQTDIRNNGQGIFRQVPSWTGPRGGRDFDVTWIAEREGRDLKENPQEGSYCGLQFLNTLPGGDFSWREVVVDASDAESMGSFTSVARFHHEEAWGDVPFWEVPALGWRKSMRGLPDKRLRGRSAQCFGLESRWNGPKLWIFPLQPAVFGEVGRAAGHREVWSSDFRWAAGGGIRVPMGGGKAVLRADYGWSEYGNGLYIDFGQAF